MNHAHFAKPSIHTGAHLAILVAAACSVSLAHAQNNINAMPPSNVVQLSSHGSVEVQQDILRISLNTTKQGRTAAQVQSQLQQALDAALKIARSHQKGSAFRMQTGQFSVFPMHNRNQKISTWQGTATLIISGTDIARVSSVAGKIKTLTVSNTSFGISPELRKKTENQAQAQAITDFRSKAETITRQFGFSKYNLRAVTVQAENHYGGNVMAYARKANMESSHDAAPIPTQPGKSTVRVQVHGSVQMQR